MDEIRILGVLGSLCADSYPCLALRAAQALVPENVVLELVELHGVPVFSAADDGEPPPAALHFKRRVLAADAILFATPEYDHSFSGALENAIRWTSDAKGCSVCLGKPAAVMGASVGSLGTARAQYRLRKMLSGLNMSVINQPDVMISNADLWFDQNGRLTDEPTRALIRLLLRTLTQSVSIGYTGKRLAA